MILVVFTIDTAPAKNEFPHHACIENQKTLNIRKAWNILWDYLIKNRKLGNALFLWRIILVRAAWT